ncbi:MAG: hypothetical protein HYR73_07750 [Candidatus Eisenbacteria bacterium]|nr:hypothetical protein [Candidatus Eisenbacteria bacterium]
MRRHAPRIAILVLAWLSATGEVGVCPLFRPATPEQGGTGTLVHTNYSLPDSTLATLARGVAAKVNGTDAYMGGIADTTRDHHLFRAFFDAAIVARYTSNPNAQPVPNPWNTDLERTFFFNFVQYKSLDYKMTWASDVSNPIDDLGPDFATLHRSYQVTNRLSDGTDAIIAVGYADLFFVHTSSGRWVIVNWVDRVDPAFGGANPPNPDQICIGWRRLNLR